MVKWFWFILLCLSFAIIDAQLTQTITTTTTGESLPREIYNSLDQLGWVCMWGGWFVYWLSKIKNERQNRGPLFKLWIFFDYNILEIILSFIAVILLAIVSNEIPPTVMDFRGKLSLILVGHSASSILNTLLSSRRKIAPTATTENYPGDDNSEK